MASSQKQHYEHGLKNSSFKTFRTTFEPFRRRKIKSGNLKISLSSELRAISDREISDVRQKMKAIHQESVKIAQVKRSRLHSILFDNTSNKTDKKQILGVILDTCSHFIRKRSRNSRYITFSSALNEPKSFSQNESCETCISEGSDSSFSGFRFKKINISFAALLVFAMCFFVSCGGDSVKSLKSGDSVSNFGKLGGECYPNETCDKGVLCDTANNICIEDPEDPTDTGSDKPGDQEKPDEQNNQNDQDKPVEQPDEDIPENPNDQDIPVEQPDEDIPENPNDQDIPVEQPDQDHQENQNDQDTPVEQPDQDVPVNPDDVCHGEGCQGNRGCKPGYFWIEKNASNFIDTGGDPDYHCVPCTALDTLAEYLRNSNKYCPGGDDLKGKTVYDEQTEKCPEYTRPNDKLDDCVCIYGVPPPPKEECFPPAQTTRKKPLIISPKVNSSLK
jgi:hypothetical protein